MISYPTPIKVMERCAIHASYGKENSSFLATIVTWTTYTYLPSKVNTTTTKNNNCTYSALTTWFRLLFTVHSQLSLELGPFIK